MTRTDMRERILQAAREELAENGPAALSMRAIARRLDVAVGGLYRYVKDRDGVLTELVVEAYEGIGAAAERGIAEAGTDAAPAAQWMGAWHAVHSWARAHPHDFDLIYGTPVVGYAAPGGTIAAAMRILRALVGLVVPGAAASGRDAPPSAEVAAEPMAAGGAADGTADGEPAGKGVPAALAADVEMVLAWCRENIEGGARISGASALGALRAWTELVGTIGFGLHGHYVGSIEHLEAYTAHVAAVHATALGLEGA